MRTEAKNIRVVKKVTHDDNGIPKRTWYEVQYQTWRPFTQYGSPMTFQDKDKAVKWALRKKAGAVSNQTTIEVVA